ncbi:cell division protein FtsZ [Membranicola marinus]|uniref:Cell division protein FtsZ n=1 Tax=Membranihabitans marinus TaxID=1227546 RepID=A0A953HXI2_9BACT|nr:cell division protein FtsZ [Membranihabitans marinus]MBY5957542.1 cell division protein FtsZ [Membranihabitans marinus]
MEFDIPSREKSIIKVVGVGGGGCNAVTHMYRQGIVGVDFALCNTDHQSMDLSPVPIKIQLGPNLTEGRGAGSKPEVGKKACLESLDEIESFMADGTKMVFVTAGMGGGTGTGAAPIIAKTAREQGILTVGIVTLPFSFEGKSRIQYAEEGLAELTDNVDALIIVSNNKLREIYGNLRVSDAFSHADNILTTAAKGIAEIITVPGYVNVDFEDVNTVMRESGVAIMGIATGEGEDRASVAVREALDCPLLEENDIRGAKDILLNIASGTKEITMDEIFEITEHVQEAAGNDTNLIWGNCYDESLGEQICVTVIATGFNRGSSDEKEEEPANESVQAPKAQPTPVKAAPAPGEIDFEVATHDHASTVIFDEKKERPSMDEIAGNHNSMKEPFVEQKPVARKNVSISERSFKPSRLDEKKMYAHKNIVELENVPAYKRRRVHLDDPVDSSHEEGPSWTYNQEDDEPEIRRNSPYLHDNVD